MSAEKLAFWLAFYPARSVFNKKWQSFLHIWVIYPFFPSFLQKHQPHQHKNTRHDIRHSYQGDDQYALICVMLSSGPHIYPIRKSERHHIIQSGRL
jgi:hypothetical protein